MAAEFSEKLRRLVDAGKTFAAVSTLLPDGSPHLAMVWMGRDGGDLVFSTGAGSRKVANLRGDARITVMLNPAAAPYTYAEVRGTATVEEDGGPELLDRLSLAYEGKPYEEFSGTSPAGTVVVRITPRKILDTL
jgi:PPOX class probable F420-dependent enzyme